VEEATFASYSPEKARALVGALDGQIAALEQLKARVMDAAGRFEAGGTDGWEGRVIRWALIIV
jgi:hypothetical protein